MSAKEMPTCSWRGGDGIIRFSVTSDGTTGEEWIGRLESKGSLLSNWVKGVLRSPDFNPTSGVATNIVVIKETVFWGSDDNPVIKEARRSTKPNIEVACLIREMFGDHDLEAMGLVEIVVMHEPISGLLFCVNRYDLLISEDAVSGEGWHRDAGFAFVDS